LADQDGKKGDAHANRVIGLSPPAGRPLVEQGGFKGESEKNRGISKKPRGIVRTMEEIQVDHLLACGRSFFPRTDSPLWPSLQKPIDSL